MNCDDATELLAAKIAVEIEDECHRQLAAHLAGCADCRATELAWQRDDRLLNRMSVEDRTSADRIVDVVIGQLPEQTVTSGKKTRMRGGLRKQNQNWQSLALATAVGFLVAAVFFQTRAGNAFVTHSGDQPQTLPGPSTDVRHRSPASLAVLASLVTVTGPIQCRPSGSSDWMSVSDTSAFRCESATEVQTSASSQCEILTDAGCILRLNNNTKLTIESGQRVKIERGQLWCRSEADAQLEVVTDASDNSDVSDPLAIYRCDARGCCLVAVDENAVQLHAAAGKITLITPEGDRPVVPGQPVRVTRDGVVVQHQQLPNALLAAGWMDALLMRKRPDDPDLILRVNALLARIGQTKASYLHERELRGLGEHCVLPLTRFVQSEISVTTPQRRVMAMRVLADASPSWNIRDLIGLLSDHNPDIRVLAATALHRLTGESFGRLSQDWNVQIPKNDDVRKQWAQWWDVNGSRYPSRESADSRYPEIRQAIGL